MNGESGLMLNGHRALITGAGRGLGEACAKTLSQAGSEVVLVARSRDQLETVRQTINDSGGNASVHVADLTKMDEIRRLEGLGAFTILVNNAGINRPEPFEQVNEKDFDDVMDLNVKSAFFVAQSVVKGMIQAGRGGSVIHMSSQMGHVGGKKRTVYCATKHAMEGFSKAMALDLAAHKIRVNTVCPTFIETAMTKPFMENKEFMQDILNRIPLGYVGQPEDVAGAVLYLASDASRLVTGSSIKVDGGWTAV
ncbi:MAG: SDR family NAD(P)-dependent oxidoreductase [Deltaproteobacteria bacterium]|nr:SDR family NAD(P)-dependent oxidoreductase [Deltaproteobacteria bacterium]